MLDASTSPLTHAIIGALLEVHKELGPGFLESAYQEAVAVELAAHDVAFRREAPIPISYKGGRLNTVYRADFLCADAVILELKAQSCLGTVDYAQVIHYLKATRRPIGLLANFGEPSLKVRRFVGPAHGGSVPSVESVV